MGHKIFTDYNVLLLAFLALLVHVSIVRWSAKHEHRIMAGVSALDKCRYSVIATTGKKITSVLIITQISSELAEPEGTGGTVGILLGLDIDEFKHTMTGEAEEQRKQKVTEIMVAFLLFTLLYAIASAILIWGTIVEQCQCAVPWLICEAFSFATQVSTLAIHAIALRTRKDKVVICVSILKLGLSPYFWLVVFCAQRTWARQRRESKANELRHNTLTDSKVLPLPNKYAQV